MCLIFANFAAMLKSKNPNYVEYVQYKISVNPFMHRLGFEITKIEEGLIEGEMVVREDHAQQNGYVHGGVTSALCDMSAGFAAYSLVAGDQHVFTVEIKISYLNPGIGQKLFAKGWVLKPGKRFHFCESEIYIENKGERKLMAKATTTMAVLKLEDKK